MRELWSKILRALHLRRGLDDELTEEMRAHLDFLIEENLVNGMPAQQASAAARRHFGNTTRTLERAHEAWQFPRIETFLQDIRYSLRAIRRAPGLSLVLLLTMALGIGANAAIFSVVYSVLLRPLPYPAGERLVWLGESTEKANGISVTWLNFEHWRAENRTFDEMAGFTWTDLTLTGRGDAQLLHAAIVTSSLFHLTGSEPVTGRLFTEEDDRPGAPPVVVLSGEFWAGAMGADRGTVGQTLVLNGKAFQIIGVLRPGLRFYSTPVDIYLPLVPSKTSLASRSQHGSMRALGRLRAGVSLSDGRADLDGIMGRLALTDPGPEDDHRTAASYLTEFYTAGIRETLVLMMGAAGLILVLACANVASILLVRATARTREIAIRAAIGAGRGRIARQLLTESLVIGVLGGAIGLLLAGLSLRILVRAAPANIPRLAEASIDIHVLIFAAAATTIVALGAGVAPVFVSSRVDLVRVLKEGAAGSGAGRPGQYFRASLVVAEIAITLILVFSSGLLVRSLIAAQNRYPGFDSDHLLALELQLPPSKYRSDENIHQFYDRLTGLLRAEPGVVAVGSATCPPSAGDCGDWWYSVLGQPAPARGDVPLCLFNTADSRYFDTLGMRLLAGRGFDHRDIEKGPPVVVVNEELARKWFPVPSHAVGQQIKWGGPYMEGPVCEIVGVVGNVSQMGLDADPMPEAFFPFTQRASSAMVVMIRTAGDSASLIPTVRSDLASIDQNIPVQSLRPFEKWMAAPLERRRFTTLLLGVFASLAIVLAAVGIYGVLNFWVGSKQKEIAIRVALGARRGAILSWAGAHALRLAIAGIALGALGGWGASRWLKSLVFGVSAQDPAMMLWASVGVILVAAVAVSLPLIRAIRVDAVRNLHDA